MSECKHTTSVHLPPYENEAGETVYLSTEQSTLKDLDTGRMICSKCDEVVYYTGSWKEFYEKGTPCSCDCFVDRSKQFDYLVGRSPGVVVAAVAKVVDGRDILRKAMGLDAVGLMSKKEMHPDDAAIDAFAQMMKDKMSQTRALGCAGWQHCGIDTLSRKLRECVEKGDPIDVANYAMMLHALGSPIVREIPPSGLQTEEHKAFVAHIESQGNGEITAFDVCNPAEIDQMFEEFKAKRAQTSAKNVLALQAEAWQEGLASGVGWAERTREVRARSRRLGDIPHTVMAPPNPYKDDEGKTTK